MNVITEITVSITLAETCEELSLVIEADSSDTFFSSVGPDPARKVLKATEGPSRREGPAKDHPRAVFYYHIGFESHNIWPSWVLRSSN